MNTGSMEGGPGATFAADITPGTTRDGVAAVQRDFSTRRGEPFPLPGFSISGSGDFRVQIRAVRAHDVIIIDLASYGGPFTAGSTGVRDAGDRVLVNLMRRGAFRFGLPDGRVTVPAGSFLAHDNGVPTLCEAGPGTAAKVLILP